MAPKISLLMEQSGMVYFPGQNINGRVKVESSKKIKCTSLTISFNGFASVSWTAKSFGRRRKRGQGSIHNTYTAHETYYEGKQQLWTDASQEMAAGRSEFAFTFVVPLNSPASFVGAYGQVLHQLTIKLASPKAFKDITVVQPFSVNAVVDLNVNPNARTPQLQQRDYNPCFWRCRRGPLVVVVRLDKSGYAPGEPIIINAEVNNKNKAHISGTKAKLIMEATFKAAARIKQKQHTLAKVSKRSVPIEAEIIWENEELLIPPLPPSPLPGCSLIDIAYKLQFVVSFKGATSDLKMDFPINLGTIPTVDSFPTAPEIPGPSAPPPYNPNVEVGEGAQCWTTFPGLEQYPQIPPPTYQQATAGPCPEGGKIDITAQPSPASSSQAGASFTPYYVSYTRQNSTLRPLPAAPSSEKTSVSNGA